MELLNVEHCMHTIIYDVAVSLDGFISGPSGDISKFAHEGPVVDDYCDRLAGYATAIMGGTTYEFGYRFGLKAGQNPYATMETIVFSDTLKCPDDSDIVVKQSRAKEDFHRLKQSSKGPIYLCGGGVFAGWLLCHGLIDRIILKRAPIILGGGVRLFGETSGTGPVTRVATRTYDNGYLLEEFVL